MTSAQLEELFAKYGKIASATVITDKFTGRSKGFGFVEFEVDEEADKAMELNGTDIEGRKIAVNVARPLEPRADRPYDNKRSFGGGGGYQKRDQWNRH